MRNSEYDVTINNTKQNTRKEKKKENVLAQKFAPVSRTASKVQI